MQTWLQYGGARNSTDYNGSEHCYLTLVDAINIQFLEWKLDRKYYCKKKLRKDDITWKIVCAATSDTNKDPITIPARRLYIVLEP